MSTSVKRRLIGLRSTGWCRLPVLILLLATCFMANISAASALPNPFTTVYRFYNPVTGAHLYTTDSKEWDSLRNNRSFQYDGTAYSIWKEFARTPLHRFYNMKTGVHFYSANASEVARIQTTMSGTYRYEGVAYNVGGYGLAVHRFLNVRTGVHFYSANAAEVANVQANLSSIYHYEGIAFYAPQTSIP